MTLMYALTLVIFGLMSFKSMPSALFPNIDFRLNETFGGLKLGFFTQFHQIKIYKT